MEDDRSVARYWEENADLWTEHVRRGWDAYREHYNNPAFFQFLGEVRGKRVLDAGCGEGCNTRILSRMGAEVTGIDLSSKLIEHARQAEAREPLGIHYEVASFSRLEGVFAGETFDLIVSTMALMDGPDYEGACRELFRVLRPGGGLVASLIHPCFITPGHRWLWASTGSARPARLSSSQAELVKGRDEDGLPEGLVVADYFDSTPRLEHWRFSKGPIPPDTPKFAVPCFPRTLSQYLNGLIEAGFRLRELEEPRPSEEACSKHPWLKRWRVHASPFLYLRAEKPRA